MLLICGVHGVGKTGFANELCKELSLKCYTAGSLIQNRTDQFICENKRVKAVIDNQKLLLEAIGEIKEWRYILDGYLCLINNKGKVERIPFEVFSKMQIEGMYIVIDRPQKISKRLQKRDKKKWNINFIKKFQEEEISYALELTRKLCIPLNIIYENKQISSFSILGDENIILPIKPLYADKILNGEKKYEFRKKLCQKNVRNIYIYATTPIKRIVGEAEVVQKWDMNKNDLWEKTKSAAGISKEFYNDYFANKDCACAYQIGKIKRYSKSISLESLGIEHVPQSFVYYGELKQ